MQVSKLLVTIAVGSSLLGGLGGLGCDSGSSAELEAAKAELASARAEIERSIERLDEATAELKAAREALELAGQASATSAVRAAEDDAAADGLSEAAAAAIRCVAEKCKVDRAFVSAALSNPAHLSRQARVVPSVKDGVTEGFKLYGIRAGSIPKLFGLKNGDLLTAVNGTSLRSMDEALTAYSAHKHDEKFVIRILRKDQPITLTVELVDAGELPAEAPASPE